jgi:hypothetical protein
MLEVASRTSKCSTVAVLRAARTALQVRADGMAGDTGRCAGSVQPVSGLCAAIDSERGDEIFVELEPDAVAGVDVGAVDEGWLAGSGRVARASAFGDRGIPVRPSEIAGPLAEPERVASPCTTAPTRKARNASARVPQNFPKWGVTMASDGQCSPGFGEGNYLNARKTPRPRSSGDRATAS